MHPHGTPNIINVPHPAGVPEGWGTRHPGMSDEATSDRDAVLVTKLKATDEGA